MIIRSDNDLRAALRGDGLHNQITSEAAFLNRRGVLKTLAATGVTAMGLPNMAWAKAGEPLSYRRSTVPGAQWSGPQTAESDATQYNNFYEFGLDKDEPARRASAMRLEPWSLRVEGDVLKPRTWSIEELLKLAPMEERVYRFRCVEAWAMVVPWLGYSLSHILEASQPKGSARYVSFVTHLDEKVMPGLAMSGLDWPYQEGLRMDEAMHPLTMMVFGMYGKTLPPQNGAPLRLMVPWKYGFKSAKSLVTIRVSERQPKTAWNEAAPHEYGFYANVNPAVSHPRWSQASERVLGSGWFAKRQPTLPFNGYADHVANLYSGMNLRQYF